jgi:glycosyltransferase involved in cell wall biosynthesis
LPLEHGRSVIYVPVGDAEALAEAIGKVSTNEILRSSLGTNAMRTVTEHYSWGCYGERVAGYLREAVGKK